MNSVKLQLEPHYEYYAPLQDVPQEIHDALGFPPLVHQLETYNQLKSNHVVFNSFSTGTGKTLAAYLHLLDRPNDNALVIAPTNALITQHAQDLTEFKNRSGIPHNIVEVDAAKLREIKSSSNITRNQDVFYKLLNNPYEFSEALQLDITNKSKQAPIVLVTNPDLFYYALYGLVNRIDRRNLTMGMFSFFDYIVIDEFHYYDSRQFCAFLFFIAVSYSFGFFNEDDKNKKTFRRLAILTATPNNDILKYFDRLVTKGLKYNLVSPDKPYVKGEAICTLSPMEVELTLFASRNSANFAEQISTQLLQGFFEQSMTGAIISDRLVDISMLSHKLRNECAFEKVTGAVSKHDRPKILTTPLLLATPTVDIGYNFRREDKDRQNIDFLLFIAEYYDEFWQRIGRAGRVLGKNNQEFTSQVRAFIPEPEREEDWSELQQFQGQTLTHQELKNITRNFLGIKPFNSTYIASQGLSATFSSFAVMLQSLPADDVHILENALSLIQEVFAPNGKPKTLDNVWGYVSESKELNQQITSESLPKEKLLKKFLLHRGEPATNTTMDKLKDLLQNHPEAQDVFNDYLSARRTVFQAQTSFRGSGDEISTQVYDPQHFLTNTKITTTYNLMHLLRYFHLNIYEHKQDFTEESEQTVDGDLQVELIALLDKSERPVISFRLETNDDIEIFEKRYLHKFWAFQGLDIVLKVGDSIRQLETSAQQALKETYLPITLFKPSDKKFINKYLREFKVFPRDIEISFIKHGESHNYLGIVGEMGEQALTHLNRFKRWTRHVNSYEFV